MSSRVHSGVRMTCVWPSTMWSMCVALWRSSDRMSSRWRSQPIIFSSPVSLTWRTGVSEYYPSWLHSCRCHCKRPCSIWPGHPTRCPQIKPLYHCWSIWIAIWLLWTAPCLPKTSIDRCDLFGRRFWARCPAKWKLVMRRTSRLISTSDSMRHCNCSSISFMPRVRDYSWSACIPRTSGASSSGCSSIKRTRIDWSICSICNVWGSSWWPSCPRHMDRWRWGPTSTTIRSAWRSCMPGMLCPWIRMASAIPSWSLNYCREGFSCTAWNSRRMCIR